RSPSGEGRSPPSRATVVRVRYEETDALRVVHHANFLRYFEVARVELLRALGLPYRELEARGCRLAVVEARGRYRAPARFDDLLDVTCRVARVRATRIDLGYEVRREGELLCEGETVLASLDEAGRPTRLPAEVVAALAPTEAAP
ncbi:MAG TPA: thioesterase family protein, partial [Planctomycetota bacterium]|nr:thioesterase family protein [Planctomycetota bacterium]